MKRYAIICATFFGAILALICAPGVINFVTMTASKLRCRLPIEQTFSSSIRPAATWVQEFRTTEKRLPTQGEMDAWLKRAAHEANVSIWDSPPNWIERTWQMGTDFILVGGVPEWNLYYHSWDKNELSVWTD